MLVPKERFVVIFIPSNPLFLFRKEHFVGRKYGNILDARSIGTFRERM